MANIGTLIDDIYEIMEGGVDVTPFHHEEPEHNKGADYVRLSSVGQPCQRKLWYEINQPENKEPQQPHTKVQFMIGHVIEHVILDLAKQAGHEVLAEQEEVEVNGIRGHLDAVIDGTVVDVKSASPYSFGRFEAGLTPAVDKFGYLTQLGSYLGAMRDDPRVTEKNKAAFLVIQKVTGKLHLDVHEFTDEQLEEVGQLIDERKEIVEQDHVPDRAFTDVPIGKSGNRGLDTNCSYCHFKHTCWPGIRTFLYASGPVFLTRVERPPNVPEAE